MHTQMKIARPPARSETPQQRDCYRGKKPVHHYVHVAAFQRLEMFYPVQKSTSFSFFNSDPVFFIARWHVTCCVSPCQISEGWAGFFAVLFFSPEKFSHVCGIFRDSWACYCIGSQLSCEKEKEEQASLFRQGINESVRANFRCLYRNNRVDVYTFVR